MLKVNVNVFAGSELVITKKVLINPEMISEVQEPGLRTWCRGDFGDGDTNEMGAIIIMANGNVYRTPDNVLDILKAIEESTK